MKRILIIEDNILKEAQMKEALESINGYQFEFTTCRSIKAAYPVLEHQKWDLVLLDMSFQINQYAGKEIKKKPLAGRQILQLMRARQSTSPVIVVTQHSSFSEGQTSIASIDEMDKKFRSYFPGNYRATVLIDLAADAWHETLVQEVEKAIGTR